MAPRREVSFARPPSQTSTPPRSPGPDSLPYRVQRRPKLPPSFGPGGDRRPPPRRVPSGGNWQRRHSLEGDGVLSSFYYYLSKKNKALQSCPLVRFPDTVIFEHSFPRAWFYMDFKTGEVQKRQGRFLDSNSILQVMSKVEPDAACEVCAQYLFTQEDDHGERRVSVEFLNPEQLQGFLQRKVLPDGVLQKFLPPRLGAVANAQIQVIWSPQVTVIQRRVNKHRLNDRSHSLYERAVTFDGPATYSGQGLCSGRAKDDILQICSAIVEHFASTEHKLITRMVLYFKVSGLPQAAQQGGCTDGVWLLWASSLRVGAARPNFEAAQPRAPVDLCLNFASPDTATEDAPDAATLIRQLLPQTDQKQYELSGHLRFSHDSPACGNWPPPAEAELSATRMRSGLLRDLPVGSISIMRPAAESRHGGTSRRSRAPSHDGGNWWDTSRELSRSRHALMRAHEVAQSYVDEVLYLIYSEQLRGREAEGQKREPFSCSLPRQIIEFLGSSSKVDELMGGILGLRRAPAEDLERSNRRTSCTATPQGAGDESLFRLTVTRDPSSRAGSTSSGVPHQESGASLVYFGGRQASTDSWCSGPRGSFSRKNRAALEERWVLAEDVGRRLFNQMATDASAYLSAVLLQRLEVLRGAAFRAGSFYPRATSEESWGREGSALSMTVPTWQPRRSSSLPNAGQLLLPQPPSAPRQSRSGRSSSLDGSPRAFA